eukprot:3185109-Pyramimonas_sp.AAC.1
MAGKWQQQTAVEGLIRRTRASEYVAGAYPCGHTTPSARRRYRWLSSRQSLRCWSPHAVAPLS